MRLILAIEPDRRQAGHLKAIVKSIRAELVLAESAERTLAALGDRVPDVILTPALLSPRDDAALTDRLRQLGDRALHVQTLTTPLLASGSRDKTSSRGGVLSALKREKKVASGPDACDPGVFAEQLEVYLTRAAEARTAHPPQAAATVAPSEGAAGAAPREDAEWLQAAQAAIAAEAEAADD